MATYDVIVVGAGPAGLLAAIAAGRAGMRTALLERRSDITRLDRLCGQTLVSVNDYYFDELVYYNAAVRRIGFMKSGVSFQYNGPAQNCAAWHIYAGNGSCIRFGDPAATRGMGDAGCVGIALDKAALFACLLREAREAGVEVFPGVDVVGVAAAATQVRAETGRESFTGSYLIAADGTNSRIARLCGFNTGRTFYCCLLSSGGFIENLRLPEPDVLISGIAYTKPAPGYMFIFPRPYPHQHTVAFLTLDPRTDLTAVARYFMQDSEFFAAWFKDSRQLERLGSAQYVFSPVREPYRDRVLLAGDAGSCQELENTGAMLSGWKAGCAAAAAVREERIGIAGRSISDYVQWWHTTYIAACPHETYMMNFTLPYVVDSEEDFNYLCSLAGEPLPPCWNPYAAIAHLGGLMQRLMPRIAQERPALAQKLGRMALPLAELVRETTQACEETVLSAE